MNYTTLRIIKYRHSKTSPYCIDGLRENGKRKRLFFKTKEAAEAKYRQIRAESNGAFVLNDDLRLMAKQCTGELKPFGKTIRDATTFYLNYLNGTQAVVTVAQLRDQFLLSQERAGKSAVYQKDLKERLGRFCGAFGERRAATISAAELENWLHGLGLSPQSINNYRDRIAILFSYGVKRGYLEKSPVSAVARVKTVGGAPEIFTVDELTSLLEKAPADLAPCLVIGAFAGLRTAELLRLEWENVKLDRGYIEVTAKNAKSAKRRLITMSQNLRTWLEPYVGHSGKLWPSNGNIAVAQTAYHAACKRAKDAARLARWPQNGLRHSFASYHLAKHHNAAQLALEMGHVNASMIFAHYREVVASEEAERYWLISGLK